MTKLGFLNSAAAHKSGRYCGELLLMNKKHYRMAGHGCDVVRLQSASNQCTLAPRTTFEFNLHLGRAVRVASSALNVSLDVDVSGSQQTAVTANDWLTIDMEKLLFA